MYVISKRSMFIRPKTGVTGVKGFVVKPSSSPQQIPDWIKSTKEYELASQNGDIIEVITKSKAVAAPIKESSKEIKTESHGMEGSDGSDKGKGGESKKEKNGK